MALEIAGALAIGALVLWIVFAPLLAPTNPALLIPEPEAAEETRRGVALLALKEIEFDRETGKLSAEDYESLKERYSAEALAAISAEPSGLPTGATPDPEALVATHLRRLRAAPGSKGAVESCPTCGPRPEADALFCSSCGRPLGASYCSGCGAVQGPDSRFCASCGTRVAA